MRYVHAVQYPTAVQTFPRVRRVSGGGWDGMEWMDVGGPGCHFPAGPERLYRSCFPRSQKVSSLARWRGAVRQGYMST